MNKPHSEETKRKISESHKGKPSGMLGKHHTEEARGKMSEIKKRLGTKPPSRKDKKHSKETKLKISEALKRKGIRPPSQLGVKQSKESIEKRVSKLRGKKRPPFSEEWKARIKNGAKRGQSNSRWKGGVTLGDNKKAYYRKKSLERVARKNNAEGSHTLGEWQTLKAQYNWTCPACGRREPEIKLSEDHIVPLSKGGSDNIENIQPLCIGCNSRKKDKVIYYEL